MEVVSRIIQCCEAKNISIKSLERQAEIANGSIKRWDKSLPSADRLLRVAEILDVSVDWLLKGTPTDSLLLSKEETDFISCYRKLSNIEKDKVNFFIEVALLPTTYNPISSQNNTILNDAPTYSTSKLISIMGYVAAGTPILSYENEFDSIPSENPHTSYALIAKGNSMEPIIKDKEIIEVICQEELENGEIGIIKINGDITCKRFYNLLDHYELKSLNADYDTITIPKSNGSEVKIVGKVSLTQAQQSRFSLL